jgi:Ankyrin repeat
VPNGTTGHIDKEYKCLITGVIKMDIGFTRPMARGISQSTNATHEEPKVVVPGPQATHAERQKFVNGILKPGRQRFELSQLNEQQLARFIAYFRIKSVDSNDANEVARFIQGYEQYCGEKRPDRDSAIASLREHVAKEPNAAELEATLNEHTEVLGEFVENYGFWDFFDRPDRDGFTPLMRAVEENDEQLVRDLILHGAEVNDRALMPLKDGTSLLALVAESGDLQCLDRVLTSCRQLTTPADLRVALEIAADRGDWKMLARMLAYLKEVHPKAPIPVPIPALKAAVECFKPGSQGWPPKVLQRMFAEAIVNRNMPFKEKQETYRLLVELAGKDRALAVAILTPFIGVGFKISHTLNYGLPGLTGLLVEAGADIHERNNNGHDLLEIAIASNLSLPMVEEMLKAFADEKVHWRQDVCLHYAMQFNLRPLAGLLLKYGGVPSDAVKTWFFDGGDVS